MRRRDAGKKIAATVASVVVLPRAIMTAESDHAEGVTILTPERMLSIYDPTLDVKAKPALMPDDSLQRFVPLPEWITLDRVHCSEGVKGEWSVTEPHEWPNLRGRDFRVLLDGRPIKGVFEASSVGGWVRFLAMRPDKDGKFAPYSNRADPDGRYHEERPAGAVTGIAFGTVTWLVDKDALDRKPDHIEPA